MSKHLGDYDASTVIYGKFSTYRPSTGATFTLGGTPALSVYKDNSTTQSTSGVTLTADFDAVTGLNHFAIDTSADGTFYSAGSFFDIVITTGTVDGVSVTGTVVASFTIRKNSALKPTTAGRTLDVSTGGEAGLDWANIGSPTTTQNLSGTSTKAIEPTVAGRTLDVSTGGEAGIDWANIGSPTTAVNLSATNIDVDQVVASVSGAVGSVTGAVGSVTGNVGGNVVGSVGSVTATVTANMAQISGDSVAADNLEAMLDGTGGVTLTTAITGNITGNLSGSVGSVTGAVGSVTGAVGSVTGNVGGNVAGSVGSVTGLTNATIADAVWDEDATAHQTQGTFGQAIGDPAADADSIWALVNANLDATVSSRLATAGYTAPLDAAGTRSAIGLASANLDTQLDALPTAAENADAVWDEAIAGHLGAGSTGAALNGATAPTAAAVADAVWDEALAGHLSAGSTGEALNAAGAAGDPWTTAIPGAYGAGSAGYIIGNNLNATVSSRATQASVDTIDTVVDAILDDTGTSGVVVSATSVRSAVGLAAANLDAQLDALPTAAENATAAWAAGTRTLTAIDEDSTTLDIDAAVRAAIGLASANLDTQLSAVQADTDDIQSRLPAALVGGRMDASVGAMAANTLTASALAADAVAEIQSGLATSAALATVQADTDDIQTRLPAALVGGRMDASVGAMAANTLTAAALAADAVTEIQAGLSTLTPAQVNAEVDTALADVGLTLTVTGRIDAAISTRLATAGYTAPLDAAGTRAAVGLAAANLDTQLGTIDTVADGIKAKTDQLTFGATNTLNANITHVIADPVQQNGSSTTNWGGAP